MREFRFRVIFLLSCLFALALTVPTAAESAQDVAASLAAGNRVALDGMRTFHGKMRVEGTTPGAVIATDVECWRRGNDVRQKKSQGKSTVDLFRTGGRETSVTTRTEADGSKWTGATINSATTELGVPDLWTEALCLLPSPQVTLEALLAGEHTLESAEYMGSGAKRRGRLSVKSSGDRRMVITVDPSANHMIERVETYQALTSGGKRSETKSVREVESFAEVAPGIFFPKKVTGRVEYGGKEQWSAVVTFSDVAVNQPLPAGVFALRFPRDVQVTDRIAGTTYRADGQGRPTSAAKKFRVETSAPPPPPSELIRPTTSEAEPLAWWPYVWVGVAVGVGASAWWLRRRRAAVPV